MIGIIYIVPDGRSRATCLSFFEHVGMDGASHALSAKLARAEGKLPISARRHVTNKFRTAYAKVSKSNRGGILDEVMATTGMARSNAQRTLTGPMLPDSAEQVDRRKLRAKQYSNESRSLLEHVWALTGAPAGSTSR